MMPPAKLTSFVALTSLVAEGSDAATPHVKAGKSTLGVKAWKSWWKPETFWSSGGADFDCRSKRLIFEYATHLLLNTDKEGKESERKGFVDLSPDEFVWELNTALGLYGPGGPHKTCPPLNISTVSSPTEKKKQKQVQATQQQPDDAASASSDAPTPVVVWVDYAAGSDAQHVTGASRHGDAFKTVQRALDYVAGLNRRTAGSSSQPKAIIQLSPGTHYLDRTLEVGPQHSGVTIRGYQGSHTRRRGESVGEGEGKGEDEKGEWSILSGAVPLKNLTWTTYHIKSLPPASTNAYVADLTGKVPLTGSLSLPPAEGIPGLRVNGRRGTLARFPNGNPELPETSPNGPVLIAHTHGQWAGAGTKRPNASVMATTYNVRTGQAMRNMWGRDRDIESWSAFMLGIEGPCSNFDPPISYWCNVNVSGGIPYPPTYVVPNEMTVKKAAMAAPGEDDPDAGLHMPYKTMEGVELFTYRDGRWANWVFGNLTASSTSTSVPSAGATSSRDQEQPSFKLGNGGFQGARGGVTGSDYAFINAMEEFDFPNEYYYDARAHKLYYYHNGTGSPSDGWSVEATKLATLFNIKGTSQADPVKDFVIDQVKMTGTRTTHMEPHGVPSGGDWSLHRGGAVMMENTERTSITNSALIRLDANGVMINGYNRNVSISGNHFSWLGGSAILTWGNADGGYPAEYEAKWPGHGVNAAKGNIPVGTEVSYNLCREIGHYTKQASCYFHAKAALTRVHHNVMFNGPRAGINFNDGLGGGDVIEHNVVFSMVRETTDHGPFNSWDRQPYLTSLWSNGGEPTSTTAWRQIRRNIMVNNYDPEVNVDNDDGSNHYNTTHNVFIGSHRVAKVDFNGHDLHNNENMYLFTAGDVTTGAGVFLANHENTFIGNDIYQVAFAGPSPNDCHHMTGKNSTGTQDPLRKEIATRNTIFSTAGHAFCWGQHDNFGQKMNYTSDVLDKIVAEAKEMVLAEDEA